MKLLWVTSFAHDMWEASGKNLLASFANTGSDGYIFVGTEGIAPRDFTASVAKQRVITYPLDNDEFLAEFLQKNSAIIPQHLGGTCPKPECFCPNGPLDPHDRNHKQPCIGQWFNRNMSRWFRKVATMKAALELCPATETLIWVDADCTFKQTVTELSVSRWFGDRGVFYFKNKRPVIEAGIVGYRLNVGGRTTIEHLIERYTSGLFKSDPRWDDSYQIQMAINSSKVRAVDLARRVGENSKVIDHSTVGRFLAHDKGKHGRGLHIMT